MPSGKSVVVIAMALVLRSSFKRVVTAEPRSVCDPDLEVGVVADGGRDGPSARVTVNAGPAVDRHDQRRTDV